MEDILERVRKIYLVGIGGIGMSGLARILRARGYAVSGSDAARGYNFDALEKDSFKVFLGHDASQLGDAEAVCFSSAVKETNPEIIEAKKRNLPLLPRGYLLALLSRHVKTIAVTGSHGKTTTSALIAFILTRLGLAPNVFVGGIPLDSEQCAWTGNDFFVIEADESDGSFLHYKPWITVITNIDAEHLDYYKGIQALENGFLSLARETGSVVIGCADGERTRRVLAQAPHISYGLSPECGLRAVRIRYAPDTTLFDVTDGRYLFKDIMIPLIGSHNVCNTLAVLALCRHLGFDLDAVNRHFKDFSGVKRRMERIAEVDGVSFISDYAHHPREICAVLRAVRRCRRGRLVAVFQPHRYSRTQLLYRDFAASFDECDRLIVTDIYPAGEKPVAGIDGLFLFEEIRKRYKGMIEYIPKDFLLTRLPPSFCCGDLVMGLGAGDIHTMMYRIASSFAQMGRATVHSLGDGE